MNYSEPTDPLTLGWWLEVDTSHPICIYYFGPFVSQMEAESATHGYLADLKQEDVHILNFHTKYCQPRRLTIYEESLHIKDLEDASFQFFMSLVQHQDA